MRRFRKHLKITSYLMGAISLLCLSYEAFYYLKVQNLWLDVMGVGLALCTAAVQIELAEEDARTTMAESIFIEELRDIQKEVNINATKIAVFDAELSAYKENTDDALDDLSAQFEQICAEIERNTQLEKSAIVQLYRQISQLEKQLLQYISNFNQSKTVSQ